MIHAVVGTQCDSFTLLNTGCIPLWHRCAVRSDDAMPALCRSIQRWWGSKLTEFDAGCGCPFARELLTDKVLALIAHSSPRLQVVRCVAARCHLLPCWALRAACGWADMSLTVLIVCIGATAGSLRLPILTLKRAPSLLLAKPWWDQDAWLGAAGAPWHAYAPDRCCSALLHAQAVRLPARD